MGLRQILVDQDLHAFPGAADAQALSWKETAEAFRTSWDKVHDSVVVLAALELAGCYPIVTDAAKDKLNTHAVHGFDVERVAR